eukprot:1083822-Prymnesium_polylepis.1
MAPVARIRCTSVTRPSAPRSSGLSVVPRRAATSADGASADTLEPRRAPAGAATGSAAVASVEPGAALPKERAPICTRTSRPVWKTTHPL